MINNRNSLNAILQILVIIFIRVVYLLTSILLVIFVVVMFKKGIPDSESLINGIRLLYKLNISIISMHVVSYILYAKYTDFFNLTRYLKYKSKLTRSEIIYKVFPDIRLLSFFPFERKLSQQIMHTIVIGINFTLTIIFIDKFELLNNFYYISLLIPIISIRLIWLRKNQKEILNNLI